MDGFFIEMILRNYTKAAYSWKKRGSSTRNGPLSSSAAAAGSACRRSGALPRLSTCPGWGWTRSKKGGFFPPGCYGHVRQLEGHDGLAAFTQGAMKEAVRHIVGTSSAIWRPSAAVSAGALAFPTSGRCSWPWMPRSNCTRAASSAWPISVRPGRERHRDSHHHPEKACQTAYDSLRLNETDFPVIAVAVSADAENVRCAIGARPARAEVVRLPAADVRRQGLEGAAQQIAHSLTYESNMRGSADYRQDMAVVLCRRLLANVLGGDQ